MTTAVDPTVPSVCEECSRLWFRHNERPLAAAKAPDMGAGADADCACSAWCRAASMV